MAPSLISQACSSCQCRIFDVEGLARVDSKCSELRLVQAMVIAAVRRDLQAMQGQLVRVGPRRL